MPLCCLSLLNHRLVSNLNNIFKNSVNTAWQTVHCFFAIHVCGFTLYHAVRHRGPHRRDMAALSKFDVFIYGSKWVLLFTDSIVESERLVTGKRCLSEKRAGQHASGTAQDRSAEISCDSHSLHAHSVSDVLFCAIGSCVYEHGGYPPQPCCHNHSPAVFTPLFSIQHPGSNLKCFSPRLALSFRCQCVCRRLLTSRFSCLFPLPCPPPPKKKY